MRIGEVAERTALSFRSLRHWDDVGLVQPSARTEGGFRLYTEKDVDRILIIRRMKPLGSVSYTHLTLPTTPYV